MNTPLAKIILSSLSIIVLLSLSSCKDKTVSEPWCDAATVAKLQSLTGTQATTSTCSTVQGTVVFRKDAHRCPSGAFYLEDTTGSMFLCDPSVVRTDSLQGVVACPKTLTDKVKADTSTSLAVQAEGLYYPAKSVCPELLCKCQKGIEIERIQVQK